MCVFPGLSPPHSLTARLTYQRPWLRPPAQRLHNASAAGTQLNTGISSLTDAIFALSVIPDGTLMALHSSDPCCHCLLSHWLTSPSDVNNWSALLIFAMWCWETWNIDLLCSGQRDWIHDAWEWSCMRVKSKHIRDLNTQTDGHELTQRAGTVVHWFHAWFLGLKVCMSALYKAHLDFRFQTL